MDPPLDLFERLGIQLQDVLPSLSFPPNEAGPLKHFQVLGNGVQRHLEGVGQFGHARRAEGKPRQDRAPSGIRDSREHGSESIHSKHVQGDGPIIQPTG